MRAYCIVLALILFSFSPVGAQPKRLSHPNVHSEGTFYQEGTTLHCDAIVVKFKDNVIPLEGGIKTATKDQISFGFPEVRQLFDNLKSRYDSLRIVKQIPSAVFGDVVRVNKRTGKRVAIEDLS